MQTHRQCLGKGWSNIYGMQAVVGHTAVHFLEDDRLMYFLDDVDDSVFSFIAHNTVITNLKSVLSNGLAPGGDGITKAVHSQLSAFHRHDTRAQESSKASSSDVVIIYSVGQTKPLLNVTVSGVLATRRRIPSTYIDSIWVYRDVPITLPDGRCILQKRWATIADRRAMTMRIAGWLGVLKSGYSDEFKEAMRKLNKHKGSMSCEDAFKQMAQKAGYEQVITRYCPQCGYPLLAFQIVGLACGMVATFESKTARSMLSVEYLQNVEAEALGTKAAGPAPREGAAASSPAPAETVPVSREAKEKIIAKALEYGGHTQLSSMRAMLARSIWRAIMSRFTWRATPQRKPDDTTQEGRGDYPLKRIRNYAADGYTPFWMQKNDVAPWFLLTEGIPRRVMRSCHRLKQSGSFGWPRLSTR